MPYIEIEILRRWFVKRSITFKTLNVRYTERKNSVIKFVIKKLRVERKIWNSTLCDFWIKLWESMKWP